MSPGQDRRGKATHESWLPPICGPAKLRNAQGTNLDPSSSPNRNRLVNEYLKDRLPKWYDVAYPIVTMIPIIQSSIFIVFVSEWLDAYAFQPPNPARRRTKSSRYGVRACSKRCVNSDMVKERPRWLLFGIVRESIEDQVKVVNEGVEFWS